MPEYFTLGDAVAVIEKLTGRTVSVETIRRWRSSGLSGVRLRSIAVGRHYHTSEAFLLEFFERVADGRETRRDANRIEAIEAKHGGSPKSKLLRARLAAKGFH